MFKARVGDEKVEVYKDIELSIPLGIPLDPGSEVEVENVANTRGAYAWRMVLPSGDFGFVNPKLLRASPPAHRAGFSLGGKRALTGYGMITIGVIYLIVGYRFLPQFNKPNITIVGYVGISLGMILISFVLLRFCMSLIWLIALLLVLGLFRYMQGESDVVEIGTHFVMCALIAAGLLNITTQRSPQSGAK